jgi:hypothetical protein
MKYTTINCCACHRSLMVPEGAAGQSKTLCEAKWRFQDGRGYCSDACAMNGPAERIREEITASYGQWGKGATPDYITGCHAALAGFDVLNDAPDYIKGHALGMSLREAGKAFDRK